MRIGLLAPVIALFLLPPRAQAQSGSAITTAVEAFNAYQRGAAAGRASRQQREAVQLAMVYLKIRDNLAPEDQRKGDMLASRMLQEAGLAVLASEMQNSQQRQPQAAPAPQADSFREQLERRRLSEAAQAKDDAHGLAFKKSEYTTGTTKQCVYDWIGTTYIRTIQSFELCPLQINVP